MSISTATVYVPAGAVTFYGLVNAIEATVANLGQWFSARLTSSAVQRLSDHHLADIGMVRGKL